MALQSIDFAGKRGGDAPSVLSCELHPTFEACSSIKNILEDHERSSESNSLRSAGVKKKRGGGSSRRGRAAFCAVGIAETLKCGDRIMKKIVLGEGVRQDRKELELGRQK